MTTPNQVVFNLDAIVETLRKGVRRADVLMGVGLNAAEQQPPISHVLARESTVGIQLVKQDLTETEKEHVAAEFGKWVRANGLRELIETFSIFLHQLYTATFYLYVKQSGASVAGVKTPARIEKLGITDQILELSNLIPVEARSLAVMRSLNQARNCYAHRQGRVGAKDVSDDGIFHLTWNRLRLQVREPDGTVVEESDMFGRVFPEGGVVEIEVVEQRREFALNDELVLGKQDLKEICLHVLKIGEELVQRTIQAAREAGLLLQLEKASEPT